MAAQAITHFGRFDGLVCLLFVAATGNVRSDIGTNPVYPAAFGADNIISVASLNGDDGFSYYSNYSANLVDIAALGRDVYNTLPDDTYGLQSGTSMAAAQASGDAGAVLSQSPDLDAVVLKQRLGFGC